jgi:hypothetical protein
LPRRYGLVVPRSPLAMTKFYTPSRGARSI